MELSSVFTQGNLVDLNIRSWSSQKKLSPEDLGMKEDSISKIFSLGHKKLMPPSVIAVFKHFDYKARQILISNSFSFGFGSARFVPKTKFVDFSYEMDALIKQFDAVADDFEKNYRRHQLDMREHYVEAAHKAWSLIKGRRPDKDQFINNFLDRVQSFYPEAKDIRSKFHMEYVVFQVAMPDITRASYEDIIEENNKIDLLQKAYEKVLIKKATEFVDSVAKELREKAYSSIGEVLDSIENKKIITNATLNKLRRMIDDYEMMDIIGDDDGRKRLKEFKARFLDVYVAKDLRDDNSLKNNLKSDLQILLSIIADKASIAALSKKYWSGQKV